MIISASRRTDIPAFYLDDFLRDLAKGFRDVVNPFNSHQTKRVSLLAHDVELIIFWTKDARMLIHRAKELDTFGIPWRVLHTLTPYGIGIEPGLPDKRSVQNAFRRLSDKVGPDRVAWRYDPVIVAHELSLDYHREEFGKLARELEGRTRRCIVSFVQPYRRVVRGLLALGWSDPGPEERSSLLRDFAAEASARGMRLSTCATPDSPFAGACIESASGEKDANQRKACLCAPSVDVGEYGTCRHGCVYCYAGKYAKVGG